jgi:hypothetical protein
LRGGYVCHDFCIPSRVRATVLWQLRFKEDPSRR